MIEHHQETLKLNQLTFQQCLSKPMHLSLIRIDCVICQPEADQSILSLNAGNVYYTSMSTHITMIHSQTPAYSTLIGEANIEANKSQACPPMSEINILCNFKPMY